MNPPAAASSHMGRLDWLVLITMSVCWGGGFVLMEVALQELPPLTIVAARLSFGALALCGLVFAKGQSLKLPAAAWRSLFIIALLGNVLPFSLITWGQVHITAGLASILNGTTPFFTIVIAHFLTQDEKWSLRRGLGVLIGFCGATVIVGHDALHDWGMNVLAQGAVLLAAILYALVSVYSRLFVKFKISPIQTAAGQISMAALVILPVAFIHDHIWQIPVPPLPVWGALLGAGIFSTALAFALWHFLLARTGANNVVLVTFLIPVSAIGLGIAFLGETLNLNDIIGMALIALGLVVIDGRMLKRLKISPA